MPAKTTVTKKAKARIVVVGAGAAGLACSWRLALDGHAVTVLDRGQAGRGALWASGGMLAAGFEASAELDPRHELAPRFTELLKSALSDWPEWAAELTPHARAPLGYRQDGALTPLFGAGDCARAERVQAQAEALGIEVRRLNQDQVTALEPNLARGDGALHFPEDGQLDNRALGPALAAATFAAGGRLEMGAAVQGLFRRAGYVAGVHLDDGRILEADAVVLATGAAALEDTPPSVTTRPVRGQMLAFQLADEAAPRHVIRSFSIYLAAKPGGRLIAGATVEPGIRTLETTPQALDELAAAAQRVMPGLAGVEPIESWSGLRPAARDVMPLIGELESGLIVAGGGYRNGVLLAPMMAKSVAALMGGNTLSSVAAPFRPDRDALTARRDH